jgi:hypothetical protein
VGFDSHHCQLLQTKDLPELGFLTIGQIRTNAEVETRIEHEESEPPTSRADERRSPRGPVDDSAHPQGGRSSTRPEPPTSWQTFLKAHWGVIVAADFVTTEV